jgi:hypothetical protein
MQGEEGIPQGLKPLFPFFRDRDPRLKPWGYLEAKAEVARNAKTTANPPFDFAQARLFGDDRKKCNSKATAKQ